MPLNPELKQKFDEAVKSERIVIFMKGTPDMPQCGFSANSIRVLQAYNLPVRAIDVLADPAVRQGIKDYTDWPTIPQIFIDGKFVGGNDIVTQMHQSGELKKLLGA